MANWYVSQKVASSGAGTSLAVAFKTIAEAVTAASSLDTIYIYGGIYNEMLTLTSGVNKTYNFIGVGYVEMNGMGLLNYGIVWSGYNSNVLNLINIVFKNYVVACVDNNGNTFSALYCSFYGDVLLKLSLSIDLQKNLFIGNLISTTTSSNLATKGIYKNNMFTNGYAHLFFKNSLSLLTINDIRNNIFLNYDLRFGSSAQYLTGMFYNNLYNCTIRFTATTGVSVVANSVAQIEAKYIADLSLTPIPSFFVNTTFVNPTFNNSAKGNYTLSETSTLIATKNKNFCGALNLATNIICKATASSGNCDIYNIGTDVYSLGLFGGVTNVGAIDNTNQKLYRSSVGVNNWGVFVANTEFLRTRIIKNWLGFGGLLGSLGQAAKVPSAWAYHYGIDILIKWSATLPKADLLADTSIPFVRFRYRPNETNYYVDNSGTLVGDGETGYAALVSSIDTGSDGTAGAGALVPQRIVAKSLVCIIILRDL